MATAIQPIQETQGITKANTAEAYLFRMRNRTAEEIAEARAHVFASSPDPRPLPLGATLEEVIVGQLPDDDAEAAILATLSEVS